MFSRARNPSKPGGADLDPLNFLCWQQGSSPNVDPKAVVVLEQPRRDDEPLKVLVVLNVDVDVEVDAAVDNGGDDGAPRWWWLLSSEIDGKIARTTSLLRLSQQTTCTWGNY